MKTLNFSRGSLLLRLRSPLQPNGSPALALPWPHVRQTLGALGHAEPATPVRPSACPLGQARQTPWIAGREGAAPIDEHTPSGTTLGFRGCKAGAAETIEASNAGRWAAAESEHSAGQNPTNPKEATSE